MEIGRRGKKNFIERDEVLELHEEDTRELGVAEGDWVQVVSRRETWKGRVQLSSPHRGLICSTTLFGEVASSLDGTTTPDPILKIDGLPLQPVRVEKLVEEEASAD